ncbi:MAG: hypothetical protein IPP15_04775 [Saprospiraceae bacterium]|uniref:Uncharacterized protein n=1 Tax=Candidatus Opimibacter skivensis TaxID=2982028 RepID=A0A9D7XM18_9BACT|nr:hypothetical protein [Candidatus Opimibacter skivensis]
MTSLNGLENIREINGIIYISNNKKLSSINGIRNIDPNSVHGKDFDVLISENPSLSICEIDLICNLLVRDTIKDYIHDNGPNCNSKEEILNKCSVAVKNINGFDEINIYPNPTTGNLHIDPFDKNSIQLEKILIYDSIGKKIKNSRL